MMKFIISVLMVSVVCFPISGCGDSEKSKKEKEAQQEKDAVKRFDKQVEDFQSKFDKSKF